MKIMKSTNIELSMLQQIEDHMKIHNISFAEFIRRAAASYLNHNQTVSTIIINGNEHDTEGHVNTPEPEEQPPEIKPETNKDTNNDFNWDGVNID